MPITATLATFADLPALEPGVILAWLGTYLLHSTLLLGAAWGASRLLRRRSAAVPGRLALEEGLWKAALVGGLLTASLQTGLAALPAGGPDEVAPAALAASTGTSAPAAPSVSTATLPGMAHPALEATAAASTRPDPRLSTLSAVLPGWQRLVLAGWLAGAGLLSLGLALSWLRLRLRLRGRREVDSGPARRLLDRLLLQLGTPIEGRGGARSVRLPVRLTGTPALPVPVALGVGEREICLPRRALTELGARRQEGLLAHELAHLERRDPAWLLAARAIECLLFVQPLNRLARSRLQEISELRCDAWAVAATGDRLGLARCLTEVAGWLTEGRAPLPVPGMARGRKNLGERVERILEGSTEEGEGNEGGLAGRRWMPAAGAALLLGAVLLVPGLAPESFATPDEPAAAAQDAEPARPATPPAEPEGEPESLPDPEDPEAETDLDSPEEWDDDRDGDRDFDYDYDFDFDPDSIPDPEEVTRLVAEALEVARDSMPDPAELARIREEVERAIREAERSLPDEAEMERFHEEMERALEEARASLPDEAEMSRIREELERTNHYLREDMERELRRAREELERVNEEVRRELRVERQEVRREAEREMVEARREMEEARREVAREMEEARRELEEQRRELDVRRHELEQHRRELQEQRRELERERRERDGRQREEQESREGPPQG